MKCAEAENGTGEVGGTPWEDLGGIGKNVCQKLKEAIEVSVLYSIAKAVDPRGLVKCLVCRPDAHEAHFWCKGGLTVKESEPI